MESVGGERITGVDAAALQAAPQPFDTHIHVCLRYPADSAGSTTFVSRRAVGPALRNRITLVAGSRTRSSLGCPRGLSRVHGYANKTEVREKAKVEAEEAADFFLTSGLTSAELKPVVDALRPNLEELVDTQVRAPRAAMMKHATTPTHAAVCSDRREWKRITPAA